MNVNKMYNERILIGYNIVYVCIIVFRIFIKMWNFFFLWNKNYFKVMLNVLDETYFFFCILYLMFVMNVEIFVICVCIDVIFLI